MNAAELGMIVSVLTTVVGLAEKYGPEVYDTVIKAIEVSKSKTGPTAEEIVAIVEKCRLDNEAIQAV